MNEVIGHTNTYQEAHQHTKWRRIPHREHLNVKRREREYVNFLGFEVGRVSDTLAQASLSRISETDRDSSRPFARAVAQAGYHRFEREDASLRRGDLA